MFASYSSRRACSARHAPHHAEKVPLRTLFTSILLQLLLVVDGSGQAHSAASTPPPNAKSQVCQGRTVPQLVDVTRKSGIDFVHLASPEKKYILESMSGGVLVIDYDRDGWPDIYFTNAPTVDMALKGQKAKSALYHNNHDGTFTDVTEASRCRDTLLRNGRSSRGL